MNTKLRRLDKSLVKLREELERFKRSLTLSAYPQQSIKISYEIDRSVIYNTSRHLLALRYAKNNQASSVVYSIM